MVLNDIICKNCGAWFDAKFEKNYLVATERCKNCNMAHVVTLNIIKVKEYNEDPRE